MKTDWLSLLKNAFATAWCLVACPCGLLATENLGVLHFFDKSIENVAFEGFDASTIKPGSEDLNSTLANANREPSGLARVVLRFKSDGKEQSVAPNQLLHWHSAKLPQPANANVVVLVDGSVLCGIIVTIQADYVQLQHRVFGLIKIPVATLAGIIWKPQIYPLAKLYPVWLAPSAQSEDLLYLQDGRLVQGTVREFGASTNALIDESQYLEVQNAKGVERYAMTRVAAIRFSPVLAPVKLPQISHLDFLLGDGSRLMSVSIAVNAQDPSAIELESGVVLRIRESAEFVQEVVGVRFESSGDQPLCQYLQERDISEVRGQSEWIRDQWLTFYADEFERKALWPRVDDQKTTLVGRPSFRAKINNGRAWKQLIGVVSLRKMPSASPEFADVYGAFDAGIAGERRGDQLQVRLVAVQAGKLISLWELGGEDLSLAPRALSADISAHAEVYLLVENYAPLATRTDVVFEQLRFTQ